MKVLKKVQNINKSFCHTHPVSSLCALLLCLCICGCSANTTETSSHLETTPYITAQQVNFVQNITIYTYNEKTTRLESQIVPITIHPDQTRAEAALGYLLSTSDFEFSLNSYGIPDYSLTIAGGIATVKITNEYEQRSKNPMKCFALHFSIVNTLCSIDGINYVSVYAGSSELGSEAYIGASSFLESNINDYYVEYYGNSSTYAGASQKSIVLYYGEKGQGYIVPEQRHVYTDMDNNIDTVNIIIDTMSDAPTNVSDLFSPISTEVSINNLDIDKNVMSVDFDKIPVSSLVANEALTYGSIYHTLIGVYPSIDTIKLTVNDAPITVNGIETPTITKDTFSGIIGTAVTLYMAPSSMDSLYPVNRYLSATSGISLMQVMDALVTGPTNYDSTTLTSPIFGGITIDNIISAQVVNNVAILNFDTNFYNLVKTMSNTEETIMVYAIVNTLTAREQINKVQFLINNQSFETINDHIYYTNPLYANPGLAIS